MQLFNSNVKLETLTKEDLIDLIQDQSEIIITLLNTQEHYRNQLFEIMVALQRNKQEFSHNYLSNDECINKVWGTVYGN